MGWQEYSGVPRINDQSSFKFFSFDFRDFDDGESWLPGACFCAKWGPAYGFSITPYTQGRAFVIGGVDADKIFSEDVLLITGDTHYR